MWSANIYIYISCHCFWLKHTLEFKHCPKWWHNFKKWTMEDVKIKYQNKILHCSSNRRFDNMVSFIYNDFPFCSIFCGDWTWMKDLYFVHTQFQNSSEFHNKDLKIPYSKLQHVNVYRNLNFVNRNLTNLT